MSNNVTHNSTPIIKAELKALSQGETFIWGRISSLLNLVDRHDYWREDTGTFTTWLDNHAELFGLKRSMLWRYISAGRFYNEQLRKKFPSLAHKPLEEVTNELSPENLELLAKIFRAAPENIFKPLAIKLLSGEAKRSDLRASWKAFKPILDGQTARGRGVAPPKAPIDSNGLIGERLTAAVMRNQLSNEDASWTQLKNLSTYKVYTEIALSGSHRFDLVVVTRGKTSALLMHGIEILPYRKSVNHNLVSQLLSSVERCDLFWIALPTVPDASFTAKIPRSIGLLAVKSDGIQTIRIPQRESRATKTEELSRHLLELAIS